MTMLQFEWNSNKQIINWKPISTENQTLWDTKQTQQFHSKTVDEKNVSKHMKHVAGRTCQHSVAKLTPLTGLKLTRTCKHQELVIFVFTGM
jgi:hypothetical protein